MRAALRRASLSLLPMLCVVQKRAVSYSLRIYAGTREILAPGEDAPGAVFDEWPSPTRSPEKARGPKVSKMLTRCYMPAGEAVRPNKVKYYVTQGIRAVEYT